MDRRGFLKNCALAAVSGGASTLLGAGGAPATPNPQSIRGYQSTMRYKYFGKTGEQVSVLGYGNMRLPVVNGDYSRIDESGTMRLVLYALDQGVNYLDTGWPYHGGVFKNGDFNEGGASELFVGKVLKEVGRDKVYVADKLPTWLINRPEDFDSFLDRQLQRLGTDHIDFYLLHNPVRPLWQRITGLGVVKFLEKAKKEGKIRYTGFSFHDTPELFTEMTNYYDFDFCQHAINYYDVNFQAGLSSIRRAARRGMGIVAMEPLMAGLLARHLPAPAKKGISGIWEKLEPGGVGPPLGLEPAGSQPARLRHAYEGTG